MLASGEPTAESTPRPDDPWTYTLTIPNDPRAVTICRRTLRLILTLHGLPHLTDAAELLTTELITNAVRHTKGPAAIKLRWADPVLRITAWDTAPRRFARALAPRAPDPTSDTGRGLALVEACAENWGVVQLDPHRRTPPHGRQVRLVRTDRGGVNVSSSLERAITPQCRIRQRSPCSRPCGGVCRRHVRFAR
nr:ATP-binding protein [Streptomyces europaeiscabiei]